MRFLPDAPVRPRLLRAAGRRVDVPDPASDTGESMRSMRVRFGVLAVYGDRALALYAVC